MRYTTVIDISDQREVYRNHNTRLLYLHLCLKAGYHDDDRDMISISIRSMAADTGLTVSAVRHALRILESNKLLKKTGQGFMIRKWIEPEKVPARPRTTPSTAGRDITSAMRRYDEEMEAYRRKVEQAVAACSTEELETWARELDEGRALRHHGVQINANKKNVEWLNEVIKRR